MVDVLQGLGIFWLTVSVVGLWFSVIWAYVAVMHAKAILDNDRHLSVFWFVNLAPLAVIGLVLDVVFNLVLGTICFAELPRELLFTSRVKRHWRGPPTWRWLVASWWRRQLNQIDPGHVR